MAYNMVKKTHKSKLVYHYFKPKNDIDVKEQEKRINGAFDILFKEVENKLKTKE